MLVVDIANFAGYLTDATMTAWIHAGVKKLIVGIHPPKESIARNQMGMANRYHLALEAYTFLYWAEDVIDWVTECWDIARDYDIGRMWIDCEEEPAKSGILDSVVVEKIVLALAESETYGPTGVYSRREWWQRVVGNRLLGPYPTGVAEYLPPGNNVAPIGYWPKGLADEVPKWYQFQGDADFGGIKCDLGMLKP